MKLRELALIFDGLANGLSSGLKSKDQQELLDMASVFRRFPNQTGGDFVKFISNSLERERNSLPALVERFQLYQSKNSDESIDDLISDARCLPTGDLNKLLQTLGEKKPQGRKNDKLQLLRSLVSANTNSVSEESNGTRKLSELVEEVIKQYKSIEDSLDEISYEELDDRFQVITAHPKAVVEGLLRKLEFPTGGTKREMAQELLNNLRSMKRLGTRLSTIP